MLRTHRPVAESQTFCTNCDYEGHPRDDNHGYVLGTSAEVPPSTSKWIATLGSTKDSCPECMFDMSKQITYKMPPPILVFEFPNTNIRISHKIVFINQDNEKTILHLRGIVYYGGYHFTSRVIDAEKNVWYSDGRQLGHVCQKEGELKLMNNETLRKHSGRKLMVAVYAQE